jgi:hypothetical protein
MNKQSMKHSIYAIYGNIKSLYFFKQLLAVSFLKISVSQSTKHMRISVSGKTSFYESRDKSTTYIPPGFNATAAFFSALKPVKRANVPGRANDDVENMIGITPELFTCQIRTLLEVY